MVDLGFTEAQSEELDRRILHSESRIKFWVIGGILANILSLAAVAIPLIFYLGQMQTQFASTVASAGVSESELRKLDRWKLEREIWEQAVNNHLSPKGFQPPIVHKTSE